MISPEERAQFARIKEGYRDWLERARRESDERRVAQRRTRGEREHSPDRRRGEPMDGGGR